MWLSMLTFVLRGHAYDLCTMAGMTTKMQVLVCSPTLTFQITSPNLYLF